MAPSLSRGGHKEFGEGRQAKDRTLPHRQRGCASQQIQMADVRCGSQATDLQYPHYARFSPTSDQIAAPHQLTHGPTTDSCSTTTEIIFDHPRPRPSNHSSQSNSRFHKLIFGRVILAEPSAVALSPCSGCSREWRPTSFFLLAARSTLVSS
jgi:hypothetical protein